MDRLKKKLLWSYCLVHSYHLYFMRQTLHVISDILFIKFHMS